MDLPIDQTFPAFATPADRSDPAELPLSSPVADELASRIASAQQGNEVAFQEIVALYQEPIVRFCFRWLRNDCDAQEAAQDTFVRAWQSLDRYENRGRFTSWLYRIALNVCRDRHKSRASRQHRETASLRQAEFPVVCHRPAPDEALARSGDLQKLQRGIELLPERLRVVLILCAQEGLDQQECAEVLNCSVRAVEGRLYRARKELLEWWNRPE